MYTPPPQTFCLYPPKFKFVEITLAGWVLNTIDGRKMKALCKSNKCRGWGTGGGGQDYLAPETKNAQRTRAQLLYHMNFIMHQDHNCLYGWSDFDIRVHVVRLNIWCEGVESLPPLPANPTLSIIVARWLYMPSLLEGHTDSKKLFLSSTRSWKYFCVWALAHTPTTQSSASLPILWQCTDLSSRNMYLYNDSKYQWYF